MQGRSQGPGALDEEVGTVSFILGLALFMGLAGTLDALAERSR